MMQLSDSPTMQYQHFNMTNTCLVCRHVHTPCKIYLNFNCITVLAWRVIYNLERHSGLVSTSTNLKCQLIRPGKAKVRQTNQQARCNDLVVGRMMHHSAVENDNSLIHPTQSKSTGNKKTATNLACLMKSMTVKWSAKNLCIQDSAIKLCTSMTNSKKQLMHLEKVCVKWQLQCHKIK